jgi:predicted nucleic acid-binding protein
VTRLLQADPFHVFWPDDLDLRGALFTAGLPHLQGRGQLTDRYLLTLAARNDARFATFDRSVGAGLPASSPLIAHLEVVPS